MRTAPRSRALLAGIAVTLLAFASGTGVSAADDDPGHEHPPPTTPSTTTPTPTTPPPSLPPGAVKKVVRYGPLSIPGATNPDGTHGHAHTGNQFRFFAEKPCNDCYIVGIEPGLVYADGHQANWSTDAQLHHVVFFNQSWGRSDATCGGSFLGLLGQRWFASGDERTKVFAPQGTGYYVGWWDTFHLIYELANNSASPQEVFIEMTYWTVPGSTAGMKNLEPVWFDIDQCWDSEYSVPIGNSSQTWSWTVNRPGKLIGTGGHLHDGGVNLLMTNDTTGQTLCNSVAGYGGSPAYVDHHGRSHISSMSTCYGSQSAPIATLTAGQRVTIRANYAMTAPADDVMGIAIAYIVPS